MILKTHTSGYVRNSDGLALHYPGDDSAMRTAVQLLRAHAYRMESRAVPPNSTPGAPLITSIDGKAIAWRGTAVGDTYSIERSSVAANGPWTVVCNRCATDNSTPWMDGTQPSGHVWYRVRAYNVVGVAGPYSDVHERVRFIFMS